MSYPQESFVNTKIHPESVIGKRREAVVANTLLYQLQVLKDTGRYDAFKLEWLPIYDQPPTVWPIPDHQFFESDVAKWIEGASYFRREKSIPEVDAAVKELVEMIRKAQQPDGYLNIHYVVVEPGKRFTNLRDMHELYNAGHMIEAALAHHQAYGNEDLLEPILKYVDLLCKTFGPGEDQLHGYPGHPEIELSLLRLYQRTGDAKILKLAEFFLTERGNPTGWDGRHYYEVEAEKRGDDLNKRPAYYPESSSLWYYQAHQPIIDQKTVEGHSVRAMYLLTAAADLVATPGAKADQKLLQAIERLWQNMVQRKMYVTGGIGAIRQWEGFGKDYYLPQGTDEGGCYSETCAAIGVMMLAERLLQIDLDGRYADIMELCLYNAVLTAMSHDGKAFSYDNQLASSDKDPNARAKWFTVACCPPNILRLLGQIGGYTWTHQASKPSELSVHLFVPSTYAADGIEVAQESDWPWVGDVKFSIKKAPSDFRMNVRVPAWATDYKLVPECSDAVLEKGYLTLPSSYLTTNRDFTLHIPLRHRLIAPHPLTNQTTLSLARGPIIYCVEDYDNTWETNHFKDVHLHPDAKIEETDINDKQTGDRYIGLTAKNGATRISLESINAAPGIDVEALDGIAKNSEVIPDLHFVPYYFRANREGRGQMRVGLQRMQR